jgi:hypothetical protein
MIREMVLNHEFVEYIPKELKERTIYISVAFGTVVHKCCCGCGNEVVTPLSPTDWKLIFDGESVSLSPSIGNWNFKCQSHYFITCSRVKWAGQWSQKEIDAGRYHDKFDKVNYYRNKNTVVNNGPATESENIKNKVLPRYNLWSKFKQWWI